MNQTIHQLVDEAVNLDREIRLKQDRLEALKGDLIALAEERFEKTKTDGGGWSVELTGANGDVARVTKPGPKLISSLDGEKPKGAAVIKAMGAFKDLLLKPTIVYKLVDNFREVAKEKLSPKAAAEVIKGCQRKSPMSVSFETKPAEE